MKMLIGDKVWENSEALDCAPRCTGDACSDIRLKVIRVSNPDDYNKVKIRNNGDLPVLVHFESTQGIFCGPTHTVEVWEGDTETLDLPFGHIGVCLPFKAEYKK